MFGLSVTAMRGESYADFWKTYQQLQPKLNLEFVELAIGIRTNILEVDPTTPLVIHNDWVCKGARRMRVNLNSPLREWAFYADLVRNYQVLAFSWHYPYLNSGLTLKDVAYHQAQLEDYLQTPFYLEIMPDAHWLGHYQNTIFKGLSYKLCLDLSHLNIWAKNDKNLVVSWLELLRSAAGCWHISTNNGFSDSHSPIPAGHWLMEYASNLPTTDLITFESLPGGLVDT